MCYLLLKSLKPPWNNHRGSSVFTFQRYSTSSGAPAASENHRPPLRRVKRWLSTLDPSKLTPHDWVDLGGQKTISVRWGETTQSLPLHYSFNHLGHPMEWPSFAKGFLYFHRPTPPSTRESHPASGSLRLRFAESPSDLTHVFRDDEGKDVTVDAGGDIPWSISFLTLWYMSYYAPVRPQLYSDGFVTSKSAAEIDRLLEGLAIKKKHEGDVIGSSTPQRRLSWLRKHMRVLDDVTQPWALDLDFHSVTFLVLAEDKIYSVSLRDVTMSEKGRSKAGGQQGVAWVRFELDDRKRLVLRLLRYIIPPDLDITAQNLGQMEGQLVQQHLRHNTGHWLPPKTWSADPTSILSPASYAALAKVHT